MGESYQFLNIQVWPADLPEGMDPRFGIRTLIGIVLQLGSSDKLTLDTEGRRRNHRAVSLSLCLKNLFSCHIIVDDQGS